jgi:hypothetical protein
MALKAASPRECGFHTSDSDLCFLDRIHRAGRVHRRSASPRFRIGQPDPMVDDHFHISVSRIFGAVAQMAR